MTINTTWINGLTNTYQVKNGIILKNSYLLTEAYTRIVTPIGTYEVDANFGSYIPYWINARKPTNENEIKVEISRALQPMISEGRCVGMLIKIDKLLPNKAGVFFTVDIYDENPTPYKLIANYVKG